MMQLGWSSTGRDKAARKLLMVVKDAINRSELDAKISFVFCNREPGESQESDLFLKLVESYHLPLICFSSEKFNLSGEYRFSNQRRLEYDREVMKRIETAGFRPDLCVLAGYMLIVGEEMCQRYNMINLHPAAPGGPVGTWQEVIWKLIDGQANETGVTMQLVTPELDKGPSVAYCTFSIRGKPFDQHWQEIKGLSLEEIKKRDGENNSLFKRIREHGLAREVPLIIATLKLFSQGKVEIIEKKVLDSTTRKQTQGYDLTKEINAIVKEKLSIG